MSLNNILKNPALKDPITVELNEEFNNFMKRVGEVSTIVKDMASGDKTRADAAKVLADQFLEGKVIVEDDIKMKVKENRTVINQKALKTVEAKDAVRNRLASSSVKNEWRDAKKNDYFLTKFPKQR